MTVINTYSSPEEAAIDAGMLRANGVDAHVQTGAIADIFPGAGNSPISLYVPDDQAEEARNLLFSSDK